MAELNIYVIIPVYNCKAYLEEAVESVLKQEYEHIEIVLIDDGSKDGSSALCDKLAQDHSRITVIHQENKGVSSARNTGIDHILQKYQDRLDGRYIAFLDADDAWADDFFTNTSVPEFPLAHIIRFKSLRCNSTFTRCCEPAPLEDGMYAGGVDLIRRCLNQHFGAALYACQLLEVHTIRFSERLRYSEDVLFLRKCVSLADSVALLDKIIYYYRDNPLSAVNTRNFGITYFEPMFAAYLATDIDGEGFVSWYLVDMIEEHFRHFGTVSELKQWLLSHEEYAEIARKHGGERANSVLTALDNHPLRYALKHYIIGGASTLVKKAIRVRGVSAIAEQIKYPIQLKIKGAL